MTRIKLFLKILCNKFSIKSIPNVLWTFWQVLATFINLALPRFIPTLLATLLTYSFLHLFFQKLKIHFLLNLHHPFFPEWSEPIAQLFFGSISKANAIQSDEGAAIDAFDALLLTHLTLFQNRKKTCKRENHSKG